MKRIELFVRQGLWALLFAALVGAGCSEDPTESAKPAEKTNDASINRWMFSYLKTHYLWNDAVQQTTPDYTLGYEDFLDDVLLQVAAQKDDEGRPVNYDDGHWAVDATTGRWSGSFYSNIRRYKKSTETAVVETRGTHQTATGLGIELAFYTPLDKARTRFAFIIAAVTPDSPAARAGLQRGDVISRVDGVAITDDATLNDGWKKLMLTESGTVRLTRYDIDAGKDESPAISVTAASYQDNPVWKSKTVTTSDGKKVGYLCYGSFNHYYDNELIAAFEQFRFEQIDELVLDLRYNGGGHVVSSAVLGTLVAGNAHKGDVYARTTYNPSRASETPDVYILGEAQYNAAYSNYRHDPIATALTSSVDGLQRIYVLCTDFTASASELLINGLRGVGIEVRLIGSTTDGKNVGMEVNKKTFGDYEYEFSPITFRIANGKGESDYGDGFAPDVEADEDFIRRNSEGKIVGIDFGDEEHETLFRLALQWIAYGSKPMPDYPQQAVATRGFEPLRIRPLAPVRVQDMLRLPVPEE